MDSGSESARVGGARSNEWARGVLLQLEPLVGVAPASVGVNGFRLPNQSAIPASMKNPAHCPDGIVVERLNQCRVDGDQKITHDFDVVVNVGNEIINLGWVTKATKYLMEVADLASLPIKVA